MVDLDHRELFQFEIRIRTDASMSQELIPQCPREFQALQVTNCVDCESMSPGGASATHAKLQSSVQSPEYTEHLHMSNGNGENSYARNSKSQAQVVTQVLPIILEAIDGMSPPRENVLTSVDFGCSSSPNTIRYMEAIVKRLKRRYNDSQDWNQIVPDIQVFFQDLPGSDFNLLFQLLKSSSAKYADGDDVEDVGQYFAAGVPGSFYNRLFPRSTIHIGVSVLALHFLSKIPTAVFDTNSPAYNGGHTELVVSSLATVNAYSEQADKDLQSFLAARADEMVSGGFIFLMFGIREKHYPYIVGPPHLTKEKVWNDLVSEGLIDAKLRDSYNTFVYLRTLEEVEGALERYSSVFEVQKRQILRSTFFLDPSAKVQDTAQRLASSVRGAHGDVFDTHFGKEATKLFMKRYEQNLLTTLSNLNSQEAASLTDKYRFLGLLLSRK